MYKDDTMNTKVTLLLCSLSIESISASHDISSTVTAGEVAVDIATVMQNNNILVDDTTQVDVHQGTCGNVKTAYTNSDCCETESNITAQAKCTLLKQLISPGDGYDWGDILWGNHGFITHGWFTPSTKKIAFVANFYPMVFTATNILRNVPSTIMRGNPEHNSHWFSSRFWPCMYDAGTMTSPSGNWNSHDHLTASSKCGTYEEFKEEVATDPAVMSGFYCGVPSKMAVIATSAWYDPAAST